MPLRLPPQSLQIPPSSPSVFLAGSIEMGKAEDWQSELIQALEDWPGYILNPRRPDWDSSWEQSIENPHFKEQVNWELEGLRKASLIVIYFAPETKSPISMLELGLHAADKKMLICCPPGFWRKGNIDIVAENYQIPQVDHYMDFIPYIKAL